MKNALFAAMTVAGVSILSGMAQEAEWKETQIPDQPVATTQAAKQVTVFNKASSFLGLAVMTADGKQIGTVKDLVFDLEQRKLGYALLAVKGGKDGQERIVPVPVNAVKPSPQAEYLVLNMSESVLLASTGVVEGEMPPVDTFAVGGPAEAESGSAVSASDEESPAAGQSKSSEPPKK